MPIPKPAWSRNQAATERNRDLLHTDDRLSARPRWLLASGLWVTSPRARVSERFTVKRLTNPMPAEITLFHSETLPS